MSFAAGAGRRARAAMLVVGFALLAGGTPAQAQEGRPVLGGHRFIWSPLTETAMPQTHVRNLTGGGKFTDIEYLSEIDLGGGIVIPAVKGDLLFAELEFEYMHRVQPWLGVWARFGGVGRVGTNAGSLLAQGVTAVFGDVRTRFVVRRGGGRCVNRFGRRIRVGIEPRFG